MIYFVSLLALIVAACGKSNTRNTVVGQPSPDVNPTAAGPAADSTNKGPVILKVEDKSVKAGGLLFLGIEPPKDKDGDNIKYYYFYTEKNVIPAINEIKPNDGLLTISVLSATPPQVVKAFLYAKDARGGKSAPVEFKITILPSDGLGDTHTVGPTPEECKDDIKAYTTGTLCN